MRIDETMERSTKWAVDMAHSRIEFNVRHLMIAHLKGWFNTFDADIYITDKDFTTAEIDLWIDAVSINTGDERRDAHLRSEDFFDVEQFKQIRFLGNSIEQIDENGKHDLWGDLTIKGITKKIKFSVVFNGIVKDPYGIEKAGFSGTTLINRSDWEMTFNSILETGGLLISDEVHVSIELELTKVDQNILEMQLDDKNSMSMAKPIIFPNNYY